jgi:hypothetical protein
MFPNVFTLAKIVNCQFFNGIRHIRIHFRGYGRHNRFHSRHIHNRIHLPEL